jgi:predicted transcriptional regulator
LQRIILAQQWKHFLPSPECKNRNTGRVTISTTFDALSPRLTRTSGAQDVEVRLLLRSLQDQNADLPALIGQVHAALTRVSSGHGDAPSEPPKPAVSVKKSITPDHIVCLEDGKKFKSLKRHLRTQYNMTPEQYREKWGLAPDYPMVAPNYAAARSHLAKQMGLGQQRRRRR